ncbi:hypothetical protein BJ508DRAFT_415567 [Ascobolus immersus RN42]|uniref:DUF8004 domain-containing protein n=1 Tax=Ascobolus immersus RN42 TaxID=1160509 RepID=A0A3N4I7C3_ASCIM|nr:hypothetical protein BJ508DRAFT_415567 [Ascobolus immersus RN42]
MAQRSARARSKADKISAASIPPSHSQIAGISKPTTFNPYTGLLTPTASSVGTSSSSRSAHSFSFNYRSSGSLPSTSRRSAIRSFLEQSDKVRRGLEERLSRATGNSTSKKDVLGSLETGWASMGSMKQWEGGGKVGMGMERPTRDNELWFPDGDTLVYLCEPHQQHSANQYQPAPSPSFRIKSQWLKETGSSFLIASIQDRAQPTKQQSTLGPARPLTPPEVPVKMEGLERMQSLTQTPTNSGARFEIYFPPPFSTSRETIMKHNLSTRNFIALLANKPLVGHTLGATIMELVERLDTWVPSGSAAPNTVGPNVQRILSYLQAREFDDVRNSPELAAGLLVFAERFHLKDLWREAFTHCVGMLGRLEKLPEYKEFSAITVAFMDRASLDITVRLQNTDALFTNFDFHSMWPVSSHPFSAGARQSFDRFQKFLIKHYQSRFGSWPPSQEALRHGTTSKFTRLIYNALTHDFASLYDYLVDTSITWSPAASATASALLKNSQPFHEDPTLPILPILTAFDKANTHPPLHNPYPLLPPPTAAGQPQNTKHTFLKPRHSTTSSTPAMNALLLQNSTNIAALSQSSSPLVEAYRAHERSEQSIPPREARIGRWVLIYGVLQTLGSLGGDVPGLKWTEGVEYFLNARTAGTPPWEPQGSDESLYMRAPWWKEVEKARVLNEDQIVEAPTDGIKLPAYLQEQAREEWDESGDEADNESGGEDDEKDLRELSEGLGLDYDGWRRGSVVMGGT